ncbi:hypothetical protein [Flavobacterium sp. N1994]|uniref:hypothetical protein n=1 Tax=Flavobacterium sp. N1994 TaxID=2986827 RepID=UPI002221BDCC|nr:hypothetical protein [Flavobacterium sp. N1994]
MKIKEVIIIMATCFMYTSYSFGQSKTIEGLKHKIVVEKPINWIQLPDEGPFYIIPDYEDASGETYIKLIGNDYSKTPKLEEFIEELHENIKKNHSDIKMETFDLKIKNIKKDNFMTGNYKTYTYSYENGQKLCMLFIECKKTIVQLVFSANNEERFKKYFKSFEKMAKSIKVVAKKQTK